MGVNIDRELVYQTESLLWSESPPLPLSMQWSGRCRWLVLLFVLCVGLGLWRQNWWFFGAGILGQVLLLVASLQFRISLERFVPSGGLVVQGTWLPLQSLEQTESLQKRYPENPKDPRSARTSGVSLRNAQSDPSLLETLQAWWKDDESLTFRVGQEGVLTLYLQGSHHALVLFDLHLRHSVYISTELSWKTGELLFLDPIRTHALQVTLRTPVVGRYRIHGLEVGVQDRMGLFRAYRYLRIPVLLRVLPSIPLRRIDRQGYPLRLEMREQPGAPQKRVGAGTELRDIRDYQPGDSRRNIVWKHSVRLQKLLCREFESETLMTSYLLFDMGQSMRQGTPGQRPIDYATEVVAAFCKASLAAKDAVGLVSFDGEIYRHSRADVGEQQFHRILLHLEDIHQVTDAEFAHMRLSHLASWVGHFLYREGLISQKHGQLPPSNYQTVAYLWDLFWRHPTLTFPQHWDSDRQLVEKVLRYFCRVIGLELPYRYHQWVTQKSVGLQQSLEQASSSLHAGQLIAVFSDLDDILHWDGILRVFKLIRQRRQHLVLLCPFSPWFEQQEPEQKNAQDDMLRDIFTLDMWRHRQRVQRLAKKWGIPILSMEPEVAPVALLKRLQTLRWGGRI